MIYFDHNATTPVRPEVLAVMLTHLSGLSGNPSSIHAAGQKSRSGVERARRQVSDALGCRSEEVCFTSGGTEADNWAIKGLIEAARGGHLGDRHRIVTSAIEHHAVWHTCEYAHDLGYEVDYVPVDNTGRVRMDKVEELVDDRTLLVSVMHANNETGRVQPVRQIADLCRRHGTLFHVDAVQSFGKLTWQVDDLGADLVSVSAHKINGPKGVGALFVRAGTPLKPMTHGGDHEGGRRAGTENVAGIAGFGEAAVLAQAELPIEKKRLCQLRDQLEAGVVDRLDDVVVNGKGLADFSSTDGNEQRLPNTSNIAFRGVEAEAIILGLDLQGIAVSSGSACTAGTSEPSHVLLAMRLEPRLASSSVRFSIGRGNTAVEIEHCLELLPDIVGRLRALSTEVTD